LNLRNNASSGDATFGNDLSIAGTGFISLNPLLGTSPVPNTSNLGKLTIADGQTVGVNINNGGPNSVAFTSVSISGNPTFSPTTFGYATTGGGNANLILGPISESAPGSSITVDGMTKVFLKGAGTYTGSTNINRGTLQLMASDLIPNTSNMAIGNAATGTVPTFASGGFNETLGNLTVGTDGAAIDLGAGTSSVHFAASSAQSWNGPITINNWTGGSDHLFFGNAAAALTAAQLSDITFAGHNAGAKILATGEVLPLPVLLLGDYNQDGHVNGADVTAAMSALTDLTNYQSGLGLSGTELVQIGDLSGDGKVNNLDLQGLLTYLIQGHGSVAAVPEPGTLSLVCLGGVSFLIVGVRKRHRRMPR
jgi:autotransporter-associated beta strand protein